MFLSTKPFIEGRAVDCCLSTVFGVTVADMKVIQRLSNGPCDIIGGWSGTCERTFGAARHAARDGLGADNGVLIVRPRGSAPALQPECTATAESARPWPDA